jgi:hypothetical protein
VAAKPPPFRRIIARIAMTYCGGPAARGTPWRRGLVLSRKAPKKVLL